MRTLLGATCALFLFQAPMAAAATLSILPKQVQKAIDDNKKYCEGKTVEDKGFITKRDINGDGFSDYIVKYLFLPCYNNNERTVPYCGSAGCQIQIFISVRGRYRITDIPNALEDLNFSRKHGKLTLTYYVKEGPSAEKTILVWDGLEFN